MLLVLFRRTLRPRRLRASLADGGWFVERLQRAARLGDIPKLRPRELLTFRSSSRPACQYACLESHPVI